MTLFVLCLNCGNRFQQKTNRVLLVYPFNGPEQDIEEAAKDLNQVSIKIENATNGSFQADLADSIETQEKSVRAHYLTIRDEDRWRLINDEFLNDTLVDFWMQW